MKTYGTACAPFLANRCIQQLVIDEGNDFPLAANALRNCCYVDDIMTGADSIEEAIALKEEIIKLFRKGVKTTDRFLLQLNPFLDENNILRVGGRLENANIPYNQKHPIILPSKNHITNLILLQEHQRLLHAGVQTVLANIRLRVWPINARNTIKHIIKNCVRCHRYNCRPVQQIMENLPSDRVSHSRPFVITGVDYAGPITLRASRLRKAQRLKAYIAVFICFSTKAIHLELVSNLSTEAFIAALKRFISRRGKCITIYSDNGRNFIGARHELHDLYKLFKKDNTRSELIEAASIHGIDWKFTPPSAPNFGGLWESAVKLTKHHIRRVIGSTLLTFEEFYTVLTQIEAILNSRPITGVYDDASEPSFLSPGHFLIGDALTAFSEPSLKEININRMSIWQNLTYIRNLFWQNWSVDYLNQLQRRYKWLVETPDLKTNDVVLLREDNLPPLSWALRRIIKIIYGSDNKVRVVHVKTKTEDYAQGLRRLKRSFKTNDIQTTDNESNTEKDSEPVLLNYKNVSHLLSQKRPLNNNNNGLNNSELSGGEVEIDAKAAVDSTTEPKEFIMTKYKSSPEKIAVISSVSAFLSGAKDREGGRAQRK
ncbi:uncharacterized protein LOC113390608 [Ctenocephalides felis]|uniref:uncharacterized protein LOC113390608 n=1 Tax=Ctenocephalides felis TaxID=7515 RepID=UPI000E6E2638|nr:uncharacterized protein LOC113390608 [Ctenocephalides felis]